ncbi:phospholipase D-like domain-containing protein [Arthrobacter sp. P2b]|uniref:phospholipase D-like domain-containing protein n=1 Tax=Arthrobacter sp. P2b TaxID=1938741 RepID=UPI0009A5DF0D|nr:phospholipase D-like domain-containing protein [Arthrobacter sp. P2b]SLK12190.1 PLD-like domain-containing protein [Arthrobacter sp. P2b]
MELYVDRNIARRWQKELGTNATGVKIFSPFITSSTAHSVTRQLRDGSLEVHTDFRAELFANGASSLTTLSKLMDEGHALFHVDQLHAKVIIVSRQFASVGSQNLTNGGTRNKEASVVFTEASVVSDIEKFIQPWLEQRSPITPEMVADMKALLPEIAENYRKAQTAAAEADKRVAELHALREAKERFERQQEEVRRLELLRSALHRAPTSNSVAFGKVRDVTNTYSIRPTTSLVVDRGYDLTSWHINGSNIKLNERTRYLCINEDNGKIGWARVVRTRITFIAPKLVLGTVQINGRHCKLHLEADWSRRPWLGRRAKVEIRTLTDQKICTVSIGFSTQGIAVLKISAASKVAKSRDAVNQWMEWVNDNNAIFAESVLRHFTSPFLYKGRLYGNKADVFFGPIGRQFVLRAVTIKGQPVIAARSLK